MASRINADSSNGLQLVSDSSGEIQFQSSGITKATVNSNGLSSPGHVLQVVNAQTATGTATNSTTTYADCLSASITPSSTSSKILVIGSTNWYIARAGTTNGYADIRLQLRRGSTELLFKRYAINFGTTTWNDFFGDWATNYLDSPSTTSAVTYTIAIRPQDIAVNVYAPFQGIMTLQLLEVAG